MIAIRDMMWSYELVLLSWFLTNVLSKHAVQQVYKRAHRYLPQSHNYCALESQHSSAGTNLQQLLDWRSRQRFRSILHLLIDWAFELCVRFAWRFKAMLEGNAGGKTTSRDKQFRHKLGNCTMPTKRNKAAQQGIVLSSVYSEVPSVASELLDRCNVVAQDGRNQENDRVIGVLDAIGDLLKTWRIQQQLTRAALAEQLDMTREQLLFLETGMSMSCDISIEQLKRLQEMFANGAQSKELTCLLQEYAQVRSLTENTFTPMNASGSLAYPTYTAVVN